MASFLETRDRNVVPNWRDFVSTVNLGELGTPPANPRMREAVDMTEIAATWEGHQGLSFAADLISAALVNEVPEVAKSAARFVLESGDRVATPLRQLAEHVLTGHSTPRRFLEDEPALISPDSVRLPSPGIARARIELRGRPLNAVLWMDLAYLYAIRGMVTKAEKATAVALQLAPTNRFILRSAARFYLHQNRADEAHQLVRRSAGVKNDPWLLAAEIAISMTAKNTSFFAKEGIQLAGSGAFSNHNLSELNSAIGTLEFSHGGTRKAQKHLKASLLSPTDNSLAQATWLSQNVNGLSLPIHEANFRIERPYEANVYKAYAANNWEEALASSFKWMADQPLSGKAARSAAYLASTIFEDYDLAEKISRFAQIASPDEVGFNITLAYTYARRNQLDEATAELRKVTSLDGEDWLPAAVDANYGLIAYKSGDNNEGQRLYSEAVRKADTIQDKRIKLMALLNWAVEESNFSIERAFHLFNDAKNLSKRASGPDIDFLLERAMERLETVATSEKPVKPSNPTKIP